MRLDFLDYAILLMAVYVFCVNLPCILKPRENFEKLLLKRAMQLDEPEKFYRPFLIKSYAFVIVAVIVAALILIK